MTDASLLSSPNPAGLAGGAAGDRNTPTEFFRLGVFSFLFAGRTSPPPSLSLAPRKSVQFRFRARSRITLLYDQRR